MAACLRDHHGGPMTRRKRGRKGYPSDLTDQHWELVEPLLPPAKTGGRREKHPPGNSTTGQPVCPSGHTRCPTRTRGCRSAWRDRGAHRGQAQQLRTTREPAPVRVRGVHEAPAIEVEQPADTADLRDQLPVINPVLRWDNRPVRPPGQWKTQETSTSWPPRNSARSGPWSPASPAPARRGAARQGLSRRPAGASSARGRRTADMPP
jgi:hypothetical protein